MDKVFSQNDERILNLNFPAEPQTISETLEMRGHKVNVTINITSIDSGIYALFDLELGELEELISQESGAFFNGIVTSIINDLGAEVGDFTDFAYKGYPGNDFNIVSPNSKPEENITSKGKTLLVNNRAYIWFAISKESESLTTLNQFINSYSLK